MAEWLVEEGIGEHRAILVEDGAILAAKIDWPGSLAVGQVEDALLISRRSGAVRGVARFADGEEALVDRLPPDASEGASLRLIITRPAMAEAGRFKLARARPTDEALRPAPTLSAILPDARVVHRFPVDGWDELMGDAFARHVAFAGGALLLSPTPAMTLIDIDGEAPPPALALAAVPTIAETLRKLDLGGSIGVDFPTIAEKAGRRALDEALGEALADWPHERTAMNGFGFVQLVARIERPSILSRVASDPAGAAARLLMRQAEAVREPGALLLTAHPSIRAAVAKPWEAELARRTGRSIRWQENSGLALEAGFAQAVPA